jgi:hypothetical protein
MSSRLLKTDLPGLELRLLTSGDAEQLYELVQANSTHLTVHGDYTALVAADFAALKTELASDLDHRWRFGIVRASRLIGRVDLIAVEPRR